MSASDQKLLELAAKACGMPPPYDKHGVFSAWVGSPDHGHWWDPINDDGDAMRLAVKLGIETRRPSRSRSIGRVVQSWFSADGNPMRSASSTVSCAVHGCVLEATRRSIVLAAASIGRAKQ